MKVGGADEGADENDDLYDLEGEITEEDAAIVPDCSDFVTSLYTVLKGLSTVILKHPFQDSDSKSNGLLEEELSLARQIGVEVDEALASLYDGESANIPEKFRKLLVVSKSVLSRLRENAAVSATFVGILKKLDSGLGADATTIDPWSSELCERMEKSIERIQARQK